MQIVFGFREISRRVRDQDKNIHFEIFFETRRDCPESRLVSSCGIPNCMLQLNTFFKHDSEKVNQCLDYCNLQD